MQDMKEPSLSREIGRAALVYNESACAHGCVNGTAFLLATESPGHRDVGLVRSAAGQPDRVLRMAGLQVEEAGLAKAAARRA